MGEITVLLDEARRGDTEAIGRVFTALYGDLRRLASMRLSSHQVPTLLNTTALVHESYVRFVNSGQVTPDDRLHFLSYAARVMRSVLVDFARERAAQRRGGQEFRITLDPNMEAAAPNLHLEILRVHDALEDLGNLSERLVRVVEMRYFAGMTEAEIAGELGITERTVRRDWEKARVLLASALE